jgi:3-deoxy-D-manno-octulosonic-acid transferase
MKLPAGLFAYRLATGLVSPAARIFLNQRIARGKEDKARIRERLGFGSVPRPEGKLVWVHGASVGECVSALPLIEKLIQDGTNVLVTSGTVASAKVMAKQLPAAAIHQFVPIDTPRATARFLAHWKPDVGLFVDSDMWPNLLLNAKARGVKLAMINARMSPKSFENWRHAPKTAKSLLSCFDACLAQDEVIATRFRKLGAENVQIAGNLKADAPVLEADRTKLDALREAVGGRPVLLAAQTHPGEDETILPAHDMLRQRFPDLLTILVPRHIERGREIEMLCGARRCSRRATGALPAKEDEVYIADTMGELGLFYRVASFAFVGGTLVPMGGHNPLEPAKLGCGVLAGPHIFNSATAFAAIFAGQGLGPVTASTDIAAVTARLLSMPDEAKALGQAAKDSAASLGGAVTKTISVIEELLGRHARA